MLYYIPLVIQMIKFKTNVSFFHDFDSYVSTLPCCMLVLNSPRLLMLVCLLKIFYL